MLSFVCLPCQVGRTEPTQLSFGLQDCRQDDYIGTVPYMAFELLLSENRPIIDYRQTDMWAFGATVFVMCTGKFPWREATLADKEFACYATGGAGTRSYTVLIVPASSSSSTRCCAPVW